jgi:hypothetical protein
VTLILPPVDAMTFWPDYRTSDISWQAHAPLAHWVVRAARPGRIVDLRRGPGDSRHGFAQAANGVAEVTEIWAYWTDPGPEDAALVAQAAAIHNRDPRARCLTGQASAPPKSFAKGSVDLLHLVVPRTALALRKVLDCWQAVLSEDAIVMLHGIAAARAGWADLVAAHPGRTIDVPDCGGLGIWCRGRRIRHDIHRLCGLPRPKADVTRRALSLAGARIVDLTAYELSLVAEPLPGDPAVLRMSHGDARDRVMALRDLEHRVRARDGDRAGPSLPLQVKKPGSQRSQTRPGQNGLTSLRKSLPRLYPEIEPLVLRAVKHKNDVQDDAIIGIGAKVDAQEEAILGLARHLRAILEHPLFRRR